VKAEQILAPGILLGSYPERRSRTAAPAPARILGSTLADVWRSATGYQHKFVAHVNQQAHELARQPEQTSRDRLSAMRARLARDGFDEQRIAEAFAFVTQACRSELGMKPFNTQLIAARIMLAGRLAEMATGEGKTLAAAVTAATAALAGIPVHVLTANDYLVRRDAASLRPLYQALGLTLGAVTEEMDCAARRGAYSCDITYCTAKELVFDYLRDGMTELRRSTLEQRAALLSGRGAPRWMLRGLCMAVIDEADTILIDEARVPLVLSRLAPDRDRQYLRHAWKLAADLEVETHFRLDAETRSAELTQRGRDVLKSLATTETIRWLTTRHCEDNVTMALTARHLLRRGRDFLVHDGRIQIIDECTGRRAQGRSWSSGLHQLVEIKEGCAASAQTETLSQITYQRFFPRYLRLCGVSGTLRESRSELRGAYGLEVSVVPLRMPNRRNLLPARVFANADAQWRAVVARVQDLHASGRPVLVGTDSVLDSEAMSQRLSGAGLSHAVLNACQDLFEAQVVAAAGAAGAITVATNMAGRGTDIVLSAASREVGGLHVLCCQQNAARRIDRQLVGRCGRQGDPGSAELFVSLDGPLLALYWLGRVLRKRTWRGELRQPWLGVVALHLAQWAAERRDRRARTLLMQQDRRVDDWLAFSGSRE
jgi:preprotein translocase subunit SecA